MQFSIKLTFHHVLLHFYGGSKKIKRIFLLLKSFLDEWDHDCLKNPPLNKYLFHGGYWKPIQELEKIQEAKICSGFILVEVEVEVNLSWSWTHRAVCPVEDPAGEVGRVADDARHVLGQVGVEVGPGGPEAEPGTLPLLAWLTLLTLLLTGVRDVTHPVITGSDQTLWILENISIVKYYLYCKILLSDTLNISWKIRL